VVLLRVKLRYLGEMTTHKRALPRRRDDEFDVFHIFWVRQARLDDLRTWLLENGVKTEIHYPISPRRQKAVRGILSVEYPVADEFTIRS
jgi:hypothetical protein